MSLARQLVVRFRGQMSQERLDNVRARLGLRKRGRLADAEDVRFGFRYLSEPDDPTVELSLFRSAEDAFEVRVLHARDPLPDEELDTVRRDVVDGLTELGFEITEVWQLGREGGRPYG